MTNWQTPKTDWVTNPKNPVAEDFNRIEGNIDFLKQDIETKKGIIVDALNTVGLDTELTDTHAQIANKIVAADQGTKIYMPSTTNQTIPKGFHSGQGYVVGDTNLIPENIIEGKSIFGVEGSWKGIYSNPQAFLLTLLRLPAPPKQGSLPGARFVFVDATSGTQNVIVPSGKTWFPLTASSSSARPLTYNHYGVLHKEGRTVTFYKGHKYMVLEIDATGITKTGSFYDDLALDLGTQSLIIFGSSPSSDVVVDVAGVDRGRYHRITAVSPGFFTQSITITNGHAYGLMGNWGIQKVAMSLAPGRTHTIGTVPSGEQWLIRWSTDAPGTPGYATLRLLVNDTRTEGTCLARSSSVVTIINPDSSTTSSISVFILKLLDF